MENIYSDESKLNTSMIITNSKGEDIYSYGIWHENNCPVRISGGVLKTCICDKTLTSSKSEKVNRMEGNLKQMEETLYQIGLRLDKFYPFHNIHNIDRMKWFIKAYEELTKLNERKTK